MQLLLRVLIVINNNMIRFSNNGILIVDFNKDISVGYGLTQDNKPFVSFGEIPSDRLPVEIGDDLEKMEGNNPICLHFNHPESIDVIIYMLIKAKELFKTK